jgi:carboxyl-terminal processing protease
MKFRKWTTRKTRISLIAVALAAVVWGGATRYNDVYFEIKKNFTLFSEVFRTVSLNYVDEVDPGSLMKRGVDAMLESLDPYTVLIDEARTEQLSIMTTGNYAGVGLEVGSRGGDLVVIAPFDGYDADRKGIRAGDIIRAIDGVSVETLTPEEAQELMRGEPGSRVTMTIERYGVDQPLTFELERERIEIKNIAFADRVGPNNEFGYILLNRFSQNTAEEIRNAILGFKEKGPLKGLILDLRNNPGGLLGEAVRTIDKFVDPGIEVVKTKGRSPEHNQSFSTEEVPLLPDTPLIVLQNNGSASASEIVAGALQDLDRAVILGTRSFGKGLVQIVEPLSYNHALKITTSKYYIPSGRSIQELNYSHNANNEASTTPDSLRKAYRTRNGRIVYDGKGIKPDVVVTEPTQSLLEIALMQKSHYFFFANRYAANHDKLNSDQASDQLYSEFRTYLSSQDFNYETRSERLLDEMNSQLSSDQLMASAETAMETLHSVIEQQKEAAFQKQKEQITQHLYLELVSRYEGREGQIRASLQFDPEVQQSISLLTTPTRIQELLMPAKGTH